MDPALELEHAIGYSAGISGNLIYDSRKKNKFMYAVGGSVVVGDFSDPHEQLFLKGHDDDVNTMALSLSGELVATGQCGKNSNVVVWDYVTNKLAYQFEEHDFGIQCLSFSHDDRLLVTAGVKEDGKLLVWDLATGQLNGIINLTSRRLSVSAVAFGGKYRDVKRRETADYQFATAGIQNITLWRLDAFTGTLTPNTIKVGRNFTCITFTPNYEYIYAGSSSGDITRIQVKGMKLEATINVCRIGVGDISCGTDSGGGDIVCVGGGDGTFCVWKMEVGYNGKLVNTRIQQVHVTGKVLAVSLLNNPQTNRSEEALVGTSGGFLHRISLTNVEVSPLLVSENHHGPVRSMAYHSGRSDQFVTCGNDKTIRMWDASDYSILLKMYVRDAGLPSCVDLCLDTIFTGWQDGRIRCHHCENNGEFLWQIDDAHTDGVTDICQSHNEKYLLSSGMDGAVRIWEFKTKELMSHMKKHKGPVWGIQLYSDDMHALSCGRDRSFRCWDLREEKSMTCHTQRMGAINSIALSRDEQYVITVGQERKLTVWDLREQYHVQQTDLGHGGEGKSVVVCNNVDNIFATGGTDEMVKLWDLRMLKQLAVGSGHSNTINKLGFSPDDRQIVSTGEDGSVLVWNMYLSM